MNKETLTLTEFLEECADKFGKQFTGEWVPNYDAYKITWEDGSFLMTGPVMNLYPTDPNAFWNAVENEYKGVSA